MKLKIVNRAFASIFRDSSALLFLLFQAHFWFENGYLFLICWASAPMKCLAKREPKGPNLTQQTGTHGECIVVIGHSLIATNFHVTTQCATST